MGVRFAIGRPRHIGRCGDGIFCASALGRRRRTFAAGCNWNTTCIFLSLLSSCRFFAFTNAGVNFSGMSPTALLHSIPLGITLGLLFGKIIGISGATWARCVGRDAKNRVIVRGWQCLVSPPFVVLALRVSLFIGNLAFSTVSGELINLVKIGVLCGSIIAGTVGFLILRFAAYR